jgi:hypothetical protein
LRSLYLLASILIFSPSARAIAADAGSKPPSCQPFLFHHQAAPPYHWQKSAEEKKYSAAREDRLAKKISKLPGYGSFLDYYLPWKEEQKSLTKRVQRLECILFYAKQDTDGDGRPDWQAVIDHRPSAVLYPEDDDIDGDGTPNMLDPAPFNGRIKGDGKKIPAHLVSAEKNLQKKLMEKFGILAIDHSDEHSPAVLENLLFLLENGPSFASRLKNFRYLYAFAGHDREVDIAAYHQVAKAISIGGAHTFSGKESVPDPAILSALAHEIGHALLMEKVAAADLSRLASEFGGWEAEPAGDLYGAQFFRPHPLHGRLQENRGRRPASAGPDLSNLVSSYSTTNIHEWFAETFTASVMVSLGEKGLLGEDWRRSLITVPKSRRHHWADYNNISGGLRAWFRKLL